MRKREKVRIVRALLGLTGRRAPTPYQNTPRERRIWRAFLLIAILAAGVAYLISPPPG